MCYTCVATDSLYEDAGNEFGYKKGLFYYTPYKLESKKRGFVFTIGKRCGKFQPHKRNYILKFNGIQKNRGQ